LVRLGGVRGIVISPVTCRDATDAELRGELRHEQAHLADGWSDYDDSCCCGGHWCQ